jgi:hypothetical protein
MVIAKFPGIGRGNGNGIRKQENILLQPVITGFERKVTLEHVIQAQAHIKPVVGFDEGVDAIIKRIRQVLFLHRQAVEIGIHGLGPSQE